MSVLKLGLIGAGSMGALHARVISASPRAELACVVEPNRATGRAVAQRFDSAWMPSLDDTSGMDAVIVASATEAHHELALQVISDGLPVLVEKPLADTLERCEEIITASEKADVPLMCGLLERFNPAIRTAMEFMDRPQHIIATRHSPYVARIQTGVASDLLIHDVDVILRMASGLPTVVAGQLGFGHPESADQAEDVADISMRFEDGLIATASASRLSQRKIRSLSIAELDRLIEIDLLRQDITIYRHMGASPSDDNTGLGYRQQTVIDIPVIREPREPLAAQLDYFIDLIDGHGDVERERASLLPPHAVIDHLRRVALEASAAPS